MANAAQGGKVPQFKPSKDSTLDWQSFNGGWNSLFKPTELRPNELAQTDNIMMVGAGTPTVRWGSNLYDQVGSGRVRMLDGYYNSGASQNNLLAITDSGYLVKQNNASYTIIGGASFASGYNFESVEMANNTYISSNNYNLVRYDGSVIRPYAGLSAPASMSATLMSGATGYNTYSWKVTALSNVGETVACAPVTLSNMAFGLASAFVKITWNSVSSAPSVLTGYNVYRGTQGNESLLASTDPATTNYIDVGQYNNAGILAPLFDSTSGPKVRYIIKVADRLVMAGIPGAPSQLLVSGRYPWHDRFDAQSGGGYIYVSPNDGEDITGIGIQHLQTQIPFILVFKKHSTHVVTMDTLIAGNLQLLDLESHPLTYTFGSGGGDTTMPVENDTFALGNKGIYSTGQEPQFLNQIRTNELSARIRPYIQNLSDSDFAEATATYLDYKYIVSFPTRKETIVYDYQRSCFYGPWKTPFGITKWLKYYDSNGAERWLAGADDGNVYEFSPAYSIDNGTMIAATLRTSKSSFGLFEQMKMLKLIYALFRNVKGNVNVNILAEGRDGNTTVSKSFNISSQVGATGYGNDQWGAQEYGQSDATINLTGDELARYSLVFKQFRVIQVEVSVNTTASNFEFLSFKATAVPLGAQSLPSSLKV